MDKATVDGYIQGYYTTNKTHVAWSFWASLVALLVGLGVLVAGVGLALTGTGAAMAVTTTAAGVFTQFISAGFFYLYNKNLKQLNVFYKELVQNQDILIAWSLVSHIPEAERPSVVLGLIGRLISRGASEVNPDLIRAVNEGKSR